MCTDSSKKSRAYEASRWVKGGGHVCDVGARGGFGITRPQLLSELARRLAEFRFARVFCRCAVSASALFDRRARTRTRRIPNWPSKGLAPRA